MSVGYSRFFFIFLVLRIHLEILDEGLVIAVVDDYCNCLKIYFDCSIYHAAHLHTAQCGLVISILGLEIISSGFLAVKKAKEKCYLHRFSVMSEKVTSIHAVDGKHLPCFPIVGSRCLERTKIVSQHAIYTCLSYF